MEMKSLMKHVLARHPTINERKKFESTLEHLKNDTKGPSYILYDNLEPQERFVLHYLCEELGLHHASGYTKSNEIPCLNYYDEDLQPDHWVNIHLNKTRAEGYHGESSVNCPQCGSSTGFEWADIHDEFKCEHRDKDKVRYGPPAVTGSFLAYRPNTSPPKPKFRTFWRRSYKSKQIKHRKEPFCVIIPYSLEFCQWFHCMKDELFTPYLDDQFENRHKRFLGSNLDCFGNLC